MEDAASPELLVDGMPDVQPLEAPAIALPGRELAEALHHDQYPALVRFLLFAGASWPEAQDAAQDAFTKMCTPGLTISRPIAWLRTVAWRSWVSQKVRPEDAFAELPEPEVSLRWHTPAQAAEIGEEGRQVMAQLLKLPSPRCLGVEPRRLHHRGERAGHGHRAGGCSPEPLTRPHGAEGEVPALQRIPRRRSAEGRIMSSDAPRSGAGAHSGTLEALLVSLHRDVGRAVLDRLAAQGGVPDLQDPPATLARMPWSAHHATGAAVAERLSRETIEADDERHLPSAARLPTHGPLTGRLASVPLKYRREALRLAHIYWPTDLTMVVQAALTTVESLTHLLEADELLPEVAP
ncbi:hypothetical protein NRK68_34655 (plasmid) [Streptomyces yangpuensis]|uniref:RNA polymerase sigma-70 region 2 domain-containing protein n=1 Tax=Streptomyces yangpuensis TaxID=1648182 RepID=A0ABY5Q7X7_9ACTN|nr:hypothetical protein [Streptomyces yangpuensis]UUY52409.1 hypothetical protein NRK68_34655 [Streptomyces yangpuensis]